eukprot:706377-Alexandrium_andersonii.AAC.1
MLLPLCLLDPSLRAAVMRQRAFTNRSGALGASAPALLHARQTRGYGGLRGGWRGPTAEHLSPP